MEVVSNPTPPRRSNRIRKAKEDKEGSDDNEPAPATAGSSLWSEAELQIFLDGKSQCLSEVPRCALGTRNTRSLIRSFAHPAHYHSLLTNIFAGLKEYGTAWKKIAQTLKNRTPKMVEELYQSNYNYLNTPSAAPAALVFHNILKDQYQREQSLAG